MSDASDVIATNRRLKAETRRLKQQLSLNMLAHDHKAVSFETELAMVQWQIRQGAKNIARQREILDKLQTNKRRFSLAERLLWSFEDVQRQLEKLLLQLELLTDAQLSTPYILTGETSLRNCKSPTED